ncbi:MAG: sortase, partial [Alistipes onderdonkii]|nr:sortase [Alistipes onderdonkii]
DTSIWNGNIALAAHNRGTNDYFGEIHTLDIGDRITLATKLGTRTYKVVSVEKMEAPRRQPSSWVMDLPWLFSPPTSRMPIGKKKVTSELSSTVNATIPGW